ncbi:MAG: type I methionyl aminopeptidase [Candidatus Harrisonbacteria bacterium]|nr:type I methionyl aminopeptidase [Candidatus Harrisonbacteria bacterium]
MALIKTKEEISLMRKASKVWAAVMEELKEKAQPGVMLKELDGLAQKRIESAGMTPGFLGYKPSWDHRAYPATLCTSVNEVVVHGVPSDYELREGDILSIDMGVKHQGYNCDAAVTIPIGKISAKAHNLLAVTEGALERGLKAIKPTNTLGDLGYAIQSFVEEHGMSIVQSLTGHGIGQKLHEEPMVLNEGSPGEGMRLEAGMCLAIEPMVSLGSNQIKKLADGAYSTKDDSLSAHFEHTVVVTESGVEILTKV